MPRPRRAVILTPMSERGSLASRYLRALARLNGSLGHEARAQLGNLTLQVGLLTEILKRADHSDPEARAKLERHADKAATAARELHQVVERILVATRSAEQTSGTLDLRHVLREVEALVAPLLKESSASMSLVVPSEPVTLDGERDDIQRALLVVVLEAAERIPPGGRLELRLDPDGVLEVAGPPGKDWLAAVRDLIEATGAAVDVRAKRNDVAIRLPVQTRTR